MLKKLSLTLFAVVGLLDYSLQAQTSTTVAFDSGDVFLYTNVARNVPLSAGSNTVGGDGAMLRLGYYSGGTNTTPFLGTFITLAGAGAPNVGSIAGTTTTYPNITFTNITIGDAPNNLDVQQGAYGLTLAFNPNNANTNKNLPVAGTPLVIQFYNNTTMANSTFYNAVSDALWDWKDASTTATVAMSLNDPNLLWLGGQATSYYTAVPLIPEPSTYALVLGGLAVLTMFVRRRQVAA